MKLHISDNKHYCVKPLTPVEHFNYALHCMPLPAGIIIALSIGILVAATYLQDWQSMIIAAKYTAIFTIISFGGVTIWMLKFERRNGRKILRFLVALAMILTVASLIPKLSVLFLTFHWIFTLFGILYIFISALKRYNQVQVHSQYKPNEGK